MGLHGEVEVPIDLDLPRVTGRGTAPNCFVRLEWAYENAGQAPPSSVAGFGSHLFSVDAPGTPLGSDGGPSRMGQLLKWERSCGGRFGPRADAVPVAVWLLTSSRLAITDGRTSAPSTAARSRGLRRRGRPSIARGPCRCERDMSPTPAPAGSSRAVTFGLIGRRGADELLGDLVAGAEEADGGRR